MVFLYLQFTCPPEALEAVTGAVTKTQAYDEMVSSEWIHRARDNESDVDEEQGERVAKLVGELEDNEDCVRVWTTIDSQLRD